MIVAELTGNFTDAELMSGLREGGMEISSDELFGELFRRYHRRVLSWCFRFTRDQELAMDVAQEVFLKAYRHVATYRGDSRLSTWLYVITRNHCMTCIKSRSTEPSAAAGMIPIHLRDLSATDAYADVERRQTFRLMWQMIGATLDPLEARVMALHYGEEMTLATITRTLGLSNPSGAKAYIVNARRKLNAVLRGPKPCVRRTA